MIRAIVAVDREWAIGCSGRLLVSVPEDLRQFRRATTGGIVVMGRRTFDSLPTREGLPKRENWVLTSRPRETFPAQVRVFTQESQLRAALLERRQEEIWIIGGAQLYRSVLDLCSEVRVTKLEYKAPEADVWFPNLELDPSWQAQFVEAVSEQEGAPGFSVWLYRRKDAGNALG